MVRRRPYLAVFLITLLLADSIAVADPAGSVRGMVYDTDFELPLAGAGVSIAETGEKTTTSNEGNFSFGRLKPGTYTLVFSKNGYTRKVKADVVVSPGTMTELNVWLSGEFTEMEEFVVQDVQIGTGTEAALLDLRMESPALMDSVSSELMSQAGASDAAGALKLVAGATVQDGKFAVIRGLPDRYVNSQMNAVRLPTADTDKRAVHLDQFPSAVIESIQVSKTFTPDQQGDASGGAVNLVLKGIPDERVLKLESGISFNTQVRDAGDKFLTYSGGGVDFWGRDDSRGIQSENIGGNWDGAVGVAERGEPTDYKWSLAYGDKFAFSDKIKVGGFGSFFYERDSLFYDDGINDRYWVAGPGAPMTPQYGSNQRPNQGNFQTELFDVTRGSRQVKWGTLGTIGLEIADHSSLSMLYMLTRDAEDTAILAENTRGKKSLHTYWPQYYGPEYANYDHTDPNHPGNLVSAREASPYLRLETLKYTERTTETLQFSGRHTLPTPELDIRGFLKFLPPEFDWTVARSSAAQNEPDKRQFGSMWRYNDTYEGTWPNWRRFTQGTHFVYQPSVNVNMGNFQRIWKDIAEQSDQWFMNLKIPFAQWSGDEGYVKMGLFKDKVNREYEQSSFQNDIQEIPGEGYPAAWEKFWSEEFDYPLYKSVFDIDYKGKQDISAWYYMADLPLCSFFNIIGGHRFENTELSITNDPYRPETAKLILPGEDRLQDYDPDKADVSFKQKDMLPSLGFVFKPFKKVTLRGSHSRTIARQTFKELSPITQMEYLGGDVFIGNPELKMSSLKNYDLRADYTPYEGGLLSASYFFKDVKDPIEYVQKYADFAYTTPMNYPKGELSGFEFELRQDMGRLLGRLEGLSLGANATFIDSEVVLPAEEAAKFDQPNIRAPMSKRPMTNAPEYLYNVFMTYDLSKLGLPDTKLAAFYTVRGDTLVLGAGQTRGKFVPSVYEKEYGTLNLSVSHKLWKIWNLKFQIKNLLNPKIESVYRSKYIDGDVTKTSYRKGVEFSLSLSARF